VAGGKAEGGGGRVRVAADCSEVYRPYRTHTQASYDAIHSEKYPYSAFT